MASSCTGEVASVLLLVIILNLNQFSFSMYDNDTTIYSFLIQNLYVIKLYKKIDTQLTNQGDRKTAQDICLCSHSVKSP